MYQEYWSTTRISVEGFGMPPRSNMVLLTFSWRQWCNRCFLKVMWHSHVVHIGIARGWPSSHDQKQKQKAKNKEIYNGCNQTIQLHGVFDSFPDRHSSQKWRLRLMLIYVHTFGHPLTNIWLWKWLYSQEIVKKRPASQRVMLCSSELICFQTKVSSNIEMFNWWLLSVLTSLYLDKPTWRSVLG